MDGDITSGSGEIMHPEAVVEEDDNRHETRMDTIGAGSGYWTSSAGCSRQRCSRRAACWPSSLPRGSSVRRRAGPRNLPRCRCSSGWPPCQRSWCCVVLAVSIIGIPLLLLLAPAYLAFVFFGCARGRLLRGRRCFATGRYHVGNAMAAAVGALILAAAYLIPCSAGSDLRSRPLRYRSCLLALVSRRSAPTYPSYEACVGDRRGA